MHLRSNYLYLINRSFLLIVSFLLAVNLPAPADAQGASKADATLERASRMQANPGLMERVIPGVTLRQGVPYINVFMEVTAKAPPLEEYGVEDVFRTGNLRLVRMPVASLDAVKSLRGVVRMEGDAWVKPSLDISVPDNEIGGIGADAVWSEVTWGNLRGEGVVVGMVDTGISLDHENFKNDDGTSRILWIKDLQTGVECNPHEEACNIEDELSHGTEVMGAIAGNGRANCMSVGGSGECIGVAPKADIIVAKLGDSQDWTAANVIQGLSDLIIKADELNKPIVVNLSLGWYKGSRDGTSAPEMAISNLAGPGRIIVTSAGNDALEMGHAQLSVRNGNDYRTIWMPCLPSADDVAKVYGWYDAPASQTIRVRVQYYNDPNSSTEWFQVGVDQEKVWDSAYYGKITISAPDPDSTLSASGFTITMESGVSRLSSAPWRIYVAETSGNEISVDLWVDRANSFQIGSCEQVVRFFADEDDPGSTITAPCSADDVVCVGSYNTRCRLGVCTGCSIDYGDTKCIEGVEAVGDISSFSSMGPRRGRQTGNWRKPWISAPGQVILTPDSRGSRTYSYVGGTSIASSHVTGTIALMLQAKATLTVEDVRMALKESALPSEDNEDGSWDPAWGWGRLDAYGAVKIIVTFPEPPTELVARTVNFDQVRLTWVASASEDVSYYNIYWNAGIGAVRYGSPIARVWVPGTSWTSPRLDAGKYLFGVRAVNDNEEEERNTGKVSVEVFKPLGRDGDDTCFVSTAALGLLRPHRDLWSEAHVSNRD